ncbi:sugar ABC transporter permease [Mangrovactinospora gilvigrisea]|uniref:Sugar ABC transporter permease n=1 Tax=Mangrovactinospora gilvigrisea TaxID=1428644 RepID=A0A1J7BA10_9ACTN|nr:ABC transporter permease subunit [Mangrovactinospora gilvigrisea]OIV35491.1 sugar ABC transporter permease [Mangrovactinospora gilvigrisea]
MTTPGYRTELTAAETKARKRKLLRRDIKRDWQLYALLAAPVAFLLIFNYWPMLGLQIAFKDYNPLKGIWGSPWVGFANFDRFFHIYQFWQIIENTVILNFYQLAAGTPLPIILALAINYAARKWFSRAVQMVSYAPHFISTVVIVGMLGLFLDPQMGLVNHFFNLFGINSVDFLGKPGLFRHIYVWSGVWQNLGFSTIVYLAALAGIDPSLHEAAIVDGATKLQRMRHIDLPGIMPVAIILFILNMGQALTTGFEKVLLMQNSLNLSTSEVIDTYVYKVGLASELPQYSYAAAIGMFQSAVGLLLIWISNRVARRITGSGLW